MLELRAGFKYRYGCIFAKSMSFSSSRVDTQAICSLDFWTSRVSEIDPSKLPPSAGLVIVWDELFSKQEFKIEVLEALRTIPKHYNFAHPRASTYRLRLDKFDDLHQTITGLLSDPRFPAVTRRLAVIDVCSAGVGPLEWRDILSCLRYHYDLIIGIISIVGRGFADHDSIFDENNFSWSKRLAEMPTCDLIFLTSDGLLGFNEAQTADVREPYLNNLARELTVSLGSQAFLNRVMAATNSSYFAIGATNLPSSGHSSLSMMEHQLGIIAAYICDPDKGGIFKLAEVSSPLIVG